MVNGEAKLVFHIFFILHILWKMNLDLSNPLVLIIGGILLLAMLYFWNKRNASNQKARRNRSFRSSYYERKKEREKERNP